ncbi:carboxylesterase 1 [Pyrus ussuriensis x Pyrus communis]|uniref:Carboxylesterase 1 n=1 Tax=Pyrus ussuriensis x Pyrus communis TaxID=2448454 RepID=A0A5N5F392_9ROSA|nr:carboxylesterase 1 [Pyrus ussuriensis x Pyrus communis]
MSGIISNPDGTYTRRIQFPTVPAEPNPTSPTTRVLSKDVPVNPETRTTARLFLPREALDLPASKLPLVFYYHGGAFVYLSAASSSNHDFCSDMALQLRALVVSLEYRLAPEHRLPAAYDDAVDALHWIASTKEEWVTEFTDLSSCFLMGTSAGGNLAYHAGLRACEAIGDRLRPLRIKGLILHHPFFGGSDRTGSELAMANDPILSLPGCDGAWSLALPVGTDRDHEYCNPTVAKESDDRYVGIREMGWRVLVTGCFGDPLIDRQMQLAKMLEKEGVRITTHFGDGFHGMEVIDPSKAQGLFVVLKNFVYTT